MIDLDDILIVKVESSGGQMNGADDDFNRASSQGLKIQVAGQHGTHGGRP